jgi:tripartite-type tricarboxylate transporter receptor subunit TctC
MDATSWRRIFTVAAFCSAAYLLTPSWALSQAPFYQGKTITLIVGSGAGGMGDLRARALASVLVQHIPGKPNIVFEYMPGAGGRKSANHFYNSVPADGLTLLRVSSSIVPYAVLGEKGVKYDIDKFNYLGTTEHQLYYLFFTRKEAGITDLAKLRAARGLRIGSNPVGHTSYIQSRMMAHLLGLKEPRFIPGYEGQDLDVAISRGEVDGRVTTTGNVIQMDLLKPGAADFHAAIEIPKGNKDARFAKMNLPDIGQFAKSEKEHKLLAMMRGFRSVGTILMLPPKTPQNIVDIMKAAVEKTHADPAFHSEYKKLTGGDEPSPLAPEEQANVVKELPRDPDLVALFKTFSGTAPLPTR